MEKATSFTGTLLCDELLQSCALITFGQSSLAFGNQVETVKKANKSMNN